MLDSFSGLKTQCRKCRSADVAITFCDKGYPESLYYHGCYCPGIDAGDLAPGTFHREEHFHRKCKTCGFEWIEAVPAETGDAP